jgi:polyhydroxyalkanoate synthesis regulator phasin
MTNKKVPKIVDKHIRCDEVQKYETKDWAENLIQHGEDELQNLRKLIHDEVKITLNNLGLIT